MPMVITIKITPFFQPLRASMHTDKQRILTNKLFKSCKRAGAFHVSTLGAKTKCESTNKYIGLYMLRKGKALLVMIIVIQAMSIMHM
jgi:hypothetical protein